MVRSKHSCIPPSISALIPIRAISNARSKISPPLSTPPISASPATFTAFRLTFAALRESAMMVRVTVTPSALRSTKNKLIPSSEPASPEVRAATINLSATCPSKTKVLLPSNTYSSPLATAVVLMPYGLCLCDSSRANANNNSPAANCGSNSAFCASEPPKLMTVPPTHTDAYKGLAVKVRPDSSVTTPKPL